MPIPAPGIRNKGPGAHISGGNTVKYNSSKYPIMFDSVQHILGRSPRRALHVSYILLQLLRLCGHTCNPEDFEGLKSLDLSIACDNLWRDEVCATMGWHFHPTV